jgi:pyruvate-formate lyase-activating enzyme
MESYLKSGGVYVKNADKADFLSLTGGEPTIHPDFFQLLSYFRKRLPEIPITLLSNGRRFADAKFAAGYLRAARPPFVTAIALHGPDARTHDAVAGVRGGFSQTVRGLKNLFRFGCGRKVEIRLVLHKKNIARTARTLAFLLKTFPDTSAYRVAAIHYEIEGMALKNHCSVGLRLAASAKKLGAALGLIRRFSDFRLYHFPLCAVRKELRPFCRITLPPEDRVYPKGKCGRCRRKKNCMGLMLEYYKKFGASELKPIRERK